MLGSHETIVNEPIVDFKGLGHRNTTISLLYDLVEEDSQTYAEDEFNRSIRTISSAYLTTYLLYW